ncbi:hypothetical protein ACFWMR_08455 [Amycolatopsis thailandensis]|uniref:Uncharacterized protein n=1 Tax=Amycolatopsis thailandensis TaxID=589330 RepID=A0A229RPA0_9PSEU|nr:hypothetical protein [Amycolatopsis thailandensis]OXM48385.1 hypothetical protein CFP71_33230 [Amycolatopsis thailandensis]
MSGPYGYPGQPGPPGFGYHPPQARPNGATAIIAGFLGLIAAGTSGYLPVYFFLELPPGFSIGDMPGLVLTALGLYLLAALLLLIGALSAFFRSVAGAVLLTLGSLMVIAAVLLEPLAFNASYGLYFRLQFEFESFAAIARVALFVVAPFTLIFAVIPPTLKYLRWRPTPAQPYRPRNQLPQPRGW